MGANLREIADGEFMVRMFGAEGVETNPDDYHAWLPGAAVLNRYVLSNIVEISDVTGMRMGRSVRFRILQAGQDLRIRALQTRVEEAQAVIEESNANFSRAGEEPDKNIDLTKRRVDRQMRKLIIDYAIAVADGSEENFFLMHQRELATLGKHHKLSIATLEGPDGLIEMINKAKLLEMASTEAAIAN